VQPISVSDISKGGLNANTYTLEREVPMKVVKAKGTIAKDNPDEVETEFTCRI
jgi:hypothetical protein